MVCFKRLTHGTDDLYDLYDLFQLHDGDLPGGTDRFLICMICMMCMMCMICMM